MPVKIPSSLPAVEILKAENIFVMDDLRASTQDIRPLKLLILNLMPLKIVTETDLLRLISKHAFTNRTRFHERFRDTSPVILHSNISIHFIKTSTKYGVKTTTA